MKKIMLLADSCGLPRSFPENAITTFEETYPRMLKQEFPDAAQFHLCMGGVSALDLVGQAIAYFSGWNPDIIIVQVGIDDCKPEPLSHFMRLLIFEVPLFRRLKAYIYRPSIIKILLKFRSHYRVPPSTFKRNIKKLQAVFPQSQILWMEIFTSANGGYEESRPGVLKRIDEYNGYLKKMLKGGFVPIHDELNIVGGINADHLHLNAKGHLKIFEILKERIHSLASKKN